MTRFRIRPEQSRLWIEAKSSLHPIHGEATGLVGDAEVGTSGGALDPMEPARGHVELAVKQLDSGSRLQDEEMRRRIDAGRFPTIRADLRAVTPRAEPDRYRVLSDLTFHGTTRRLPVNVTAKLDGGQALTVDGEFVLDVRAFGITPPSVLGLKVQPEVKVRLHLVLAETA